MIFSPAVSFLKFMYRLNFLCHALISYFLYIFFFHSIFHIIKLLDIHIFFSGAIFFQSFFLSVLAI